MTFIFPAFRYAPLDRLRSKMNSFVKNIAVMGDLLNLMAFGSSAFSRGAGSSKKQHRLR